VVVIINLVALSGVLHLSDKALGGLNAAVAAVLAFALALVASGQIIRVRRAHVMRAREKPGELVLPDDGMIGEVVGRDALCQVMIDDLLARRIRRVQVIIGGAGTGKTALLVRLTKLLAERHAVPVPVRLRDAQEDLDFRELARRRFIADARAALVSDADVDTVWRQLCQDDKIVVLADGLEEALTEGTIERERDNLIRLAIRQANEHRLPLVIVSRTDDSLRSVEATIVELGPLSHEAALTFMRGADPVEDDLRIDWIIETADVTDVPFYLQIACQLYRSGRLEAMTSERQVRRLDTRSIDRDGLRLALLETWLQALSNGHFFDGVPLSREDRQAAIEQLSLLACIGLRLDRREVRFDDVESLRTTSAPKIITDVEARLAKLKRRFDLRLAADWGASLELVEARRNGVRFTHSIMQAYLGSRLIDLAVEDAQYRTDALKECGQEFLLALVMHSRASFQQGYPEGVAPLPAHPDVPRTYEAAVASFLCEEASGRNDVKVIDLYAAALQIDCIQSEPAHNAIVGKLAACWKDVWAPDQRTLEDAKLRLARRFGEAARMIADNQTESASLAKPAYLDFYRISCSETSPPVRLQCLQEIGAGGDEAFVALQGTLGPPVDDLHDRPVTGTGHLQKRRHSPSKPSSDDSQEQNQESGDRVLLDLASRAWLAPVLAGSVAEKRLDARNNLEQWLQYFGKGTRRRKTSEGTALIRLPTETQILIMRELNAPRNLVYDEWISPGGIGRYVMPCWDAAWNSGPDRPEWTRVVEADLRVGGTWRCGWKVNGEFEAVFHGEYREIVPNERIVSTEIYAGMPEAEAVNTVTFTERYGRTTLIVLIQHTSKEHRDAHLNSGLGRCMQRAMDLVEWFTVAHRTHADAQDWLHPSLEAALAQGFKYAANMRPWHPHIRFEASGYLAEQALEMLRNSDFWYSRLNLVHALCLWELRDEPVQQSAGRRTSEPRAIVSRWKGDLGTEKEHPFVAEASELAVLALEIGQPERFIWMDESSTAATVGSSPASPAASRRGNLWIRPSTGWTELHPRAQQLLADVLLLLNLAERGVWSSDAIRRLRRTRQNDLPPCLSKDRSLLDPTRTVGGLNPAPGSNCHAGCAFGLCPYPPKGGMSFRAELSPAFVRRQQAVLGSRSILHQTAPWQENRPRDLRRFWKQMERRAYEYRPGQL
jgi:uncharacterized protein YndB with AHSA1/START domain